eukprot:CAMPEP_0114403300 /NCGR_PEP_ID=MMETSP0102-20121206/18719_1 /TAXON_ID=38822 ORGANISM="Pteridomonas danica, Strain PT" /NCGR_SAMPLE_ID=MMETSP0102 /ASSEMBLY_ACC=CAM_ASM_000212 /LENGTH=96 /DNA_ID=CAMNT_0001567459 /DNA_START=59 /DNA_END=347 /DNA_ORIENTATION=-
MSNSISYTEANNSPTPWIEATNHVWLVSAWIGGLVIITLAVGGIFIARKVMNRELVAKTDTIEIGHNTYLHLEDNRTIVELKDELVAVKKERDHFK